ncbi:MAG TPA: hypothetical protein VFL94_13345 [Actinomycetales bacterium]|nr:hypothetical protein [Actinomycetales bacterium]
MTSGQVVDEVDAWVGQYAATRAHLEDQLTAAARHAWLSFEGWYDAQLVAELAAELSGLSGHAQDLLIGAAQQYVGSVVGVLRGRRVEIPPVTVPPIRGGVDPQIVYSRPAEVYRMAVATGSGERDAVEKAVVRAETLGATDLMLAGRGAQHEQMKALKVTRYRRVLRPELSKHGSCGLCIAASSRIYTIGNLLPIHGGTCNCETVAIDGANDPGHTLNQDDLDRLYAAAGSTAADDLKRVRAVVHEHGELGPVLAREGHEFRGPKRVALEDDPARARQMLTKVRPVLATLEQRAAAGEDVTGPLEYQRGLLDRLEHIAA